VKDYFLLLLKDYFEIEIIGVVVTHPNTLPIIIKLSKEFTPSQKTTKNKINWRNGRNGC